MNRRTLLLAPIALSANRATAHAGSGLPRVAPAEGGFDPAALAAIRRRMEEFTKGGQISGAVTLLARRGKVAWLDASGLASREHSRPMRSDTLFWIASMTKSLTATAVMLLVEERRVSLDEPVERFLPSFGSVRLRSGAPQHRVTLRHLLSHTAGLAQPDRKPTDGSIPLVTYASDLAKAPLEFEPGTRYEYGFGPTVAGAVVEVASGMPFDRFLQERVLNPLGMADTTWHPNPEQRGRLAACYRPGARAGELTPTFIPFVTPDPAIRRVPEPSGGLFSTAEDMASFYQMVLDGGRIRSGRSLLSQASVREMTTPFDLPGSTVRYGLCWQQLAAVRPGAPAKLAGYGHGGAFGTHGMVDPERQVVAVLMIQRTLFPEGSQVVNAFHELAAKAVV